VTGSESFVLYVEASWSSPWVCASYVTLREKRLPFTTALSMLRTGTGIIDVMHERTLTGTAPVLQHGTFWLAESLAIVEYLEEVCPEPRMFPEDRQERARARQLMAWMRHHHEALRRERPAEHVLYRRTLPAPPPLTPEAADAAAALVRVTERLGADGRGALFADRFGVVDVELAFALMRLTPADAAIPARVADYVAAVLARPSVREFLDHPRPPNPP